ncbi:MAG: SCO1664 family protein [Anaerolineales bacterium]|nr:SCO1664 family protein [Anaerolineales bacterium]
MSITKDINKLQEALQLGRIKLQGQFILGSNYTFLVDVTYQGEQHQAVYKPIRGEKPLWDFPQCSLAKREVAAFLVNRSLGWDFVPATVLREDGPYGAGSLQQFIEYDPNYHYFTFNDRDRQRLKKAALFDLLINNADRKGSHILIETNTEHLWLIDHGVCFHSQDKLRTVIWDFAGQSIPESYLSNLEQLRSKLDTSEVHDSLLACLDPEEIAALDARAERLLAERRFPQPPEDRRAHPWPPI